MPHHHDPDRFAASSAPTRRPPASGPTTGAPDRPPRGAAAGRDTAYGFVVDSVNVSVLL
jgi:hypothetical protein